MCDVLYIPLNFVYFSLFFCAYLIMFIDATKKTVSNLYENAAIAEQPIVILLGYDQPASAKFHSHRAALSYDEALLHSG